MVSAQPVRSLFGPMLALFIPKVGGVILTLLGTLPITPYMPLLGAYYAPSETTMPFMGGEKY